MRRSRQAFKGLFIAVAALAVSAEAKDGKGAMITTGVAYPAVNEALLYNPAGLGDAGGSKLSFEGLWFFDPATPYLSLAGSPGGSVGLAADYTKGTNRNVFEGGMGVSLGGVSALGVTLRSNDGKSFDGDVGINLGVSGMRLGVVARGISGGVDLIAAGLGFNSGNVTLELDVLKPLPLDQKLYFFDATLGVTSGKIGLGVGYELMYLFTNPALHSGDFHAEVAYAFSPSLELKGSYNPFAGTLPAGKWAAGLKYMF